MSDTAEEELAKHLRHLEEMVASSEVRSSPPRLAPLITDDFVEFGKSGNIYDKKLILETLANEDDNGGYCIEEIAVKRLGADAALVTYDIPARTRSGEPRTASLRSSVWVRRDGRWQMLFHQGTAR